MARQQSADPWQQDYENWKGAGFPQQQPPAAQVPRPASAKVADVVPSTRPAATAQTRKLVIGGSVATVAIVAAIIGHAVASGNSIAVGDCVVTNPNVLTGWDIKKVACGSDPGPALFVQKVESVQDGSDGDCLPGLTTFLDDPAGKTYCLASFSFGGGG